MPTYEVTAPDGRVLEIDGPSPPTEADLDHIFSTVAPAPPADVSKLPAIRPMASHRAAPALVAPGGGRGTRLDVRKSDDFAAGAATGPVSTVFHGGDLLRRGWNAVTPASLNVERVIDRPEVQRAITPPDSPHGRAGFLLEQAAEAALPLGAVSRGTKGASLFRRVLADAATGGAVTATQTGGDPQSTAAAVGAGVALPVFGAMGRVAQRTAAAAADEGIGGAVASVVRAAAPQDAKTMLVQALKPRATKTGFEASLERAVPEIKAAESQMGKPISGVDDLLTATKTAKRNIQQQLDQVRGTAPGVQIDLSPVADAVDQSIPKKLQLENPKLAAALREQAQAYRQAFSLDDAEQLLRETNADLEGFYAKYPTAQRRALAADPEAARLHAQAVALRTSIDDGLDRMADGAGEAAKELRRRYGALLDVEEEAYRRANVAKRQQPESLSEQVSKVRAAADMARGAYRLTRGDLGGAADIAAAHAGRQAATYLKEQQTTDALIRRAFAGFKGERVSVSMPARRPIRGLLGRGPVITPPPADASFVRGVRADPAISGTPRVLPPAAQPLRSAFSGVDRSGGQILDAKPVEIIDPRTGRPMTIFTSEER